MSWKETKQFFTQFCALGKPYLVCSIWSGLLTCRLWSTSPFRHSSWLLSRQRSGCSSRQVTPHLGYLTNWHSLIQSVKFSLSNTLSGGPDQTRWLCEDEEEEKIHKHNSNCSRTDSNHETVKCVIRAKISAVTFEPVASAALTASRVQTARGRHPSLSLTHSDDTALETGPFDHWASAPQKGSQNREDKCYASSQEMCGNKVSTCHCCEMLQKQLAAFGLPRRATALRAFCYNRAVFSVYLCNSVINYSPAFCFFSKKGGGLLTGRLWTP